MQPESTPSKREVGIVSPTGQWGDYSTSLVHLPHFERRVTACQKITASLFLKFLEIPDLVETVGSLVEPVFANSSLLDWLQKMMWWRAGDGSSFWLATPHVPRFGVANSF